MVGDIISGIVKATAKLSFVWLAKQAKPLLLQKGNLPSRRYVLYRVFGAD